MTGTFHTYFLFNSFFSSSPGYTACYCTYIVMVSWEQFIGSSYYFVKDSTSGKIIGFYVVHKDQVSSSTAMEVSGCKTVLGKIIMIVSFSNSSPPESLMAKDVPIGTATLGTDRSPSIR